MLLPILQELHQALKLVVIIISLLVKISNGFIIQWGKSKTFAKAVIAYENQTLPISYKSTYKALNVLCGSLANSYCVSVSIVDNSNFQCVHNGAIAGFHLWMTFGF